MMTRRQLCLAVAGDFLSGEDGKALGISEPADIPETCILQSSHLAVAMEYLGLLHDPELVDYARHRGGVEYMYVNDKEDQGSLTLRDILELLPE